MFSLKSGMNEPSDEMDEVLVSMNSFGLDRRSGRAFVHSSSPVKVKKAAVLAALYGLEQQSGPISDAEKKLASVKTLSDATIRLADTQSRESDCDADLATPQLPRNLQQELLDSNCPVYERKLVGAVGYDQTGYTSDPDTDHSNWQPSTSKVVSHKSSSREKINTQHDLTLHSMNPHLESERKLSKLPKPRMTDPPYTRSVPQIAMHPKQGTSFTDENMTSNVRTHRVGWEEIAAKNPDMQNKALAIGRGQVKRINVDPEIQGGPGAGRGQSISNVQAGAGRGQSISNVQAVAGRGQSTSNVRQGAGRGQYGVQGSDQPKMGRGRGYAHSDVKQMSKKKSKEDTDDEDDE